MRSTLYLCGGLQSSGSTLVSWCFLQREDMDGILDARFDALPQFPRPLNRPRAWCKFTVACFDFSDVQSYLEDEGWSVRPVLVVRDVRAVFNSLIQKPWGRNGITADDPPLRLRLRRFLRDWRLFRDRGWPMLRYEQLLGDPLGTLKRACDGLELPWDGAMVTWPKAPKQICDCTFGNPTFVRTRGSGLTSTLDPSLAQVRVDHIPPGDLEWIEREFAEMNRAMGYAEHVPDAVAASEPHRAVPRFENTRRYERLRRKHPFVNIIAVARHALDGSSRNRDTVPAPGQFENCVLLHGSDPVE